MKRDTRIVAPIFAAIPILVLASSTICSWVISQGASQQWRSLFRVLCHGLESRCFDLWGVPMPICTRCVAIYLGLLIGLVTFAVWPYFTEQMMRIVAVAAVVPLALDGLTQLVRLRESTNGLRFGTGIVAGFAIGIWALSAIEKRDETALKLS